MADTLDQFLDGGPDELDKFLDSGPAAPTSPMVQAPSWVPAWARPIGRFGGFLGEQLNTGIAETLGVPGDLERLANHVLPGNVQLPLLPSSGDVVQGFKNIGMITGDPQNQPQNVPEDFIAAGMKSLPLALTGDMPGAAATLGGAFAGEAAHKMFPDSQVAPIVGGLLGGSITGGIATRMKSASEAADALTAGNNAEIAALRAKNQYSELTSSQSARAVQLSRAVGTLDDVVTQHATQLGGAVDTSAGNAMMENEINNWLKMDYPRLDKSVNNLPDWTKLNDLHNGLQQLLATKGDLTTNLISRSATDPTLLNAIRDDPMLSKGLDQLAAGMLKSPQRDNLWKTLGNDAQEALVGDEGVADEINDAMAHKEHLLTLHGDEIISTAREQQVAQEAALRAQQAAKPKTPHPLWQDVVGAGRLAGAGTNIGLTALGFHAGNPFLFHDIGRVAAAGIPLAARGIATGVQNPYILRNPLLGGLGGDLAP